ncbi:hypothetical protein tb265_39900 [Gemmatimonadetes bacterium T265]|nr:hypothetical protein tb265_39900 [Gemmatimonadetes bacterium T265]
MRPLLLVSSPESAAMCPLTTFVVAALVAAAPVHAAAAQGFLHRLVHHTSASAAVDSTRPTTVDSARGKDSAATAAVPVPVTAPVTDPVTDPVTEHHGRFGALGGIARAAASRVGPGLALAEQTTGVSRGTAAQVALGLTGVGAVGLLAKPGMVGAALRLAGSNPLARLGGGARLAGMPVLPGTGIAPSGRRATRDAASAATLAAAMPPAAMPAAVESDSTAQAAQRGMTESDRAYWRVVDRVMTRIRAGDTVAGKQYYAMRGMYDASRRVLAEPRPLTSDRVRRYELGVRAAARCGEELAACRDTPGS